MFALAELVLRPVSASPPSGIRMATAAETDSR